MNFRFSLFLSLGLVIASPVLGQTITNRLAALDSNFKTITPLAVTVINSDKNANLAPLASINSEIVSAKSQLDSLPTSLNVLDLLLTSTAIRDQLKTTVASHTDAFGNLTGALKRKLDRFSFEAFFSIPLANQILLGDTDNSGDMIEQITLVFQNRLSSWSTTPLIGLLYPTLVTAINESRQSLLLSIEKSIEFSCKANSAFDSRLSPSISTRAATTLDQIHVEMRNIINNCQGTACSTLKSIATRIDNAQLACRPQSTPDPEPERKK